MLRRNTVSMCFLRINTVGVECTKISELPRIPADHGCHVSKPTLRLHLREKDNMQTKHMPVFHCNKNVIEDENIYGRTDVRAVSCRSLSHAHYAIAKHSRATRAHQRGKEQHYHFLQAEFFKTAYALCLKTQDTSSLVCGSIVFFHGLTHRVSGTKLKNAVARFGEQSKVADTVFGTLHDLNGMWETHKKLEAAKPPGKRGQPFVFFTDCDMCDVANASGGQPGPDQSYSEAIWQVTPPVQFQRPLGFDFRAHCETGHTKDDPRKHGLHCEWNEVRAALNRDNMVGLAYIHDPAHDPQDHVSAAQDLQSRFDGQYIMAVFKLAGELQVHGHLVVEETCHAPDPSTAPPDAWSGRIITFEEYIKALKGRQQQGQC